MLVGPHFTDLGGVKWINVVTFAIKEKEKYLLLLIILLCGYVKYVICGEKIF